MEKRYSYKVWHPDTDDGKGSAKCGSRVFLEVLERNGIGGSFITGVFGDTSIDPPTYRILLTEQDVLALKLAFPRIHIWRSRKTHN